MTSGSHCAEQSSVNSDHHTSTSAFQVTSPPVNLWVNTAVIDGHAPLAIASSTFAFSGTLRPARRPSSHVMTTLASELLIRSAIAFGEKPPKITE